MRINCGGFELNENDFELNGVTLSLKNGGGGGGSGVTIVNYDSSTEKLDMKAGDLLTACANGPVFVFSKSDSIDNPNINWELINNASIVDGLYGFFGTNMYYEANSPDKYPAAVK